MVANIIPESPPNDSFIKIPDSFRFQIRWVFENKFEIIFLTPMCLNIGAPKTINFPFGTTGKLMIKESQYKGIIFVVVFFSMKTYVVPECHQT